MRAFPLFREPCRRRHKAFGGGWGPEMRSLAPVAHGAPSITPGHLWGQGVGAGVPVAPGVPGQSLPVIGQNPELGAIAPGHIQGQKSSKIRQKKYKK